MDIRHLRHFLMVAEERHFSRAARRLHMEQAPLSQSIKRFEDYLGGPLFDRSARGGTRLTPLGEELLPDARQIVDQFEAAMLRARQSVSGDQLPVTVGSVTAGILQLIPQAISLLQQQAPEIKVRLKEAGTTDLLDLLQDDKLDACLTLPSDYSPPGIRMEEIRRDRTLLALHRDNPLASVPELTLQALQSEPIIFFPRETNPVLYRQLNDYFAQHDFVPNIDQEARLTPTMLSLASAGLGVCFVQESARRLPFPDLVWRDIEGLSDSMTWSLMLAWKPRLATASTRRFIDCLKLSAHDPDNAAPAS